MGSREAVGQVRTHPQGSWERVYYALVEGFGSVSDLSGDSGKGIDALTRFPSSLFLFFFFFLVVIRTSIFFLGR